ncbi:MAG: flippase-like domain-containing protein [Deltaproteobacteria bacterium]|nr:flippase-like domain-containing protein [Deltaproteobacteria bacterium]MBW1996187.1 flippase-like domain-containing protein [Deltaproteobacteria bacterium]MBW2153374.1 flippase-like domain-containing protein [Deltaproteobacteria bacterium]
MPQIIHSRQFIKYGIYIVFITFFGFWLTQIDVNGLLGIIKDIDPLYILHFATAYLLSYALYAKKYQMLFRVIKKIKYSDLFFITCSGSYANFIVPVSGEILKIYALKKQEDIQVANATMVLLIERVLSLIVLLILLGIIVICIDTPKIFKTTIIYSYMGCTALAITWVFIIQKKHRIEKFIEKLITCLPLKDNRNIRIDSSDLLKLGKKLVMAKVIGYFTLYAVLKYIFDGFRLYFVLKTIGYDLGYVECLAANIIINFMIMIPMLPGSFGSFEFFSIWVLHYIFSVPLEVNFLEIFLARIYSTALLFVLGVISLNHLKISTQMLKSSMFGIREASGFELKLQPENNPGTGEKSKTGYEN